ncbi:haloacid dehalogenase type II [Alteribacillus iranensis]|uniref:2-haloacid dehalogenase n=1 Tax=Alteribacillus iranensis TaxID=930128 RepID=A0A1I2FM13_9BACI|nr:haloacid dehalogenase type II [Alteribacillus iranensis]SFF05640.1 2-haloacid dehalogenase [Alteribacillus iranensis]
MTTKAIVFDAYGTLFDVHTVVEKCEELFPGKGRQISDRWRVKQLEYSWLRAVMGRYEDFWSVTRDALTFVLKELQIEASEDTQAALLQEYLHLNPYPEVPDALNEWKNKNLAILSNGSPDMLHTLVENAGLSHCFSHLISVDELKTYKPFMGVYQLGPSTLRIPKEETLFVTSNSWDAAGAKTFGYQVCWINRFQLQFDELGVKPDLVVTRMDELVEKLR